MNAEKARSPATKLFFPHTVIASLMPRIDLSDTGSTMLKDFSAWTIDEKVVFLHEILEHRATPQMVLDKLNKVKYSGSDHYEYFTKI